MSDVHTDGDHSLGLSDPADEPVKGRVFSLVGLIDSYIATKPEKEFNTWRASSIGQCPRAHFFKRLGIESTKEESARRGRVFSAGDIFHEWAQNIVQEFYPGAKVVEQELYNEELDLGGRLDLMIDSHTIVDIKTCHSNKFTHLANEGRGADYQHRMQATAYALLKKLEGNPVEKVIVAYLSKDDLRAVEFTYSADEYEQRVYDELALLNKHWAEKTLPPCTCDDPTNRMNWQRDKAYCNYADETAYEWRDKILRGEKQFYANGKPKREKIFTKCCDSSLAKDKLITAQAKEKA